MSIENGTGGGGKKPLWAMSQRERHIIKHCTNNYIIVSPQTFKFIHETGYKFVYRTYGGKRNFKLTPVSDIWAPDDRAYVFYRKEYLGVYIISIIKKQIITEDLS